MAKIRKKKKTLNVKNIMRVFVMPISLLIIGSFTYTGISYSSSILSKFKEKEELSKNLIELKEKEQKLAVDVEKLQDPEYVGRYLREKFLYSKKGEYIIKLPQEERK